MKLQKRKHEMFPEDARSVIGMEVITTEDGDCRLNVAMQLTDEAVEYALRNFVEPCEMSIHELYNAMVEALPLYAYPGRELAKQLKCNPAERLEIADIYYAGNEGGIMCALNKKFYAAEQKNRGAVVSATHLDFRDEHPLKHEINRYIKKRQAELKLQNMSSTVNTGRNAPCPCGSGKKYKRCCGR